MELAMSEISSADTSFRQYFRNPTDDNIRRFYLESNWDWLLHFSCEVDEDLVSAPGEGNKCDVPSKNLCYESVRSRVNEDGYYSSANNDLGYLPVDMCLKTNVIKLRMAVELLVFHGYPPTFVLLLDECWDTVESMSELMYAGTGNSVCNMDILAWLVDPKEGSGFSPHRDRQPLEVGASFRSDGTAKYATCWLALSAAHCDNSCLYMIPKYLDPGYMLSDNLPVAKPNSCKRKKIDKYAKKMKTSDSKSDENYDRDPLREALVDKENYQHIRAMPLHPGEFVIFTHRILHWGSKGRKNYAGPPRISLSVAFSDPLFEAPYFSVETKRPSFEMRLALSCAQMIVYYQRYNFAEGELLLFKKCFDLHAHSFHEEYRLKVLQEYCVAVMEIETLKDAVSTDRVDNNPPPLSVSEREGGSCGSSNHLHGTSDERKVTEAYENNSDENGPGPQSSDDDGNQTGDDEDDELLENDHDSKSASGLDEIDANGEDNNSSESDEDEDGGFAFATEEYLDLDDPMENALDTLLNVELEINRNAKKPRKN